jgi:hypothetical protein
MTWCRRSLSDRTPTAATCAVVGCLLRAVWSSYCSGCGVARLCLVNRPILIKFVWSAIAPE